MARTLCLHAPFRASRYTSSRSSRSRKLVLGVLEDRTLPSATLWTQRGGDAGHSGYVNVNVNAAQIQSAWNQPLSYVASGAWAQNGNRALAIDGNQVYRTDLDGYWASGNYHILAYNLQTGAVAWNQIIVGNGPVSAPSVVNGIVYVNRSGHSQVQPSGYPYLYGLSAQTGAVSLQTTYQAQWESDDRPVIAGNQLFDWDGYYGGFSSWDPTTLNRQWNDTGSIYNPPMAAADSTYVYAYGNLVYLRSTGAAQTSITHPTGLTPSSVVISGSGDLLYTLSGTVNGTQEYGVAAYDGTTHNLLWTTYTSSAVAGKAVGNGIVAVTAGQQLLFLDEKTGSVLGTWNAPASLTSQIVLTNTHAFVETAQAGPSTIYAINVSSDASEWSFTNSVSGPDDTPYMEIAYGGGYLVATNDAFVQAFAVNTNQPPVANNDSASTPENQAVAVNVLANDSDPDGDTLTVTAVTAPSFGSAVINSDNTITYTPPADFIGSDSFTYTISDGNGNTATATVSITVTPPANGPVANPGGPYSVNEGGSVTLDGSGSTDTGGTIATYEWDYNYNGSEFITDATGVAPTFDASTLDGPITDNVALRVTDSLGNRSVAVTTRTVNDVAPTAGISGPTDGYHGVVNQQRTFALSANEPLASEQAAGFTFAVNWGDGQTDTLTGQSGLSASHTWQAAGTYTVSLTATDADGNTSSPVQLTVNILPAEKQGSIVAVGAGAGVAYSFTPGAASGTVQVRANSTLLGTFTTAQVQIYGAGTATVNGTSGADAFTLTGAAVSVHGVSISGAGMTGWAVYGLGGNNTFAINGSGAYTQIYGGPNNDTFTFAAGLLFNGSIAGNGGTDTLVANSAVGASTNWVINGAGAGIVDAAPFTGIANLTGGAGNDAFSFQNGGSITGKVNGSGGVDTLDYSQYGQAVTINLANSSAPGLATFVGIRVLLASTNYDSTVQGANGTNTWQVNGTSSGTVNGISFFYFLTLNGGTGNDMFTIASGVNFAGSLAGGGGSGVDTITANSATGTAIPWVINAAGGGTVNGTPFSGIANLTGGSGNDTFSFQSGGSIIGKVNGSSGTNTLDDSAYGSAVTVNLATSKATSTGSFASMKVFRGPSGYTNTLQAGNVTNSWQLTGASSGTVAGDTFSSFQALIGGTGNDTFTIAAGVTFSGSLTGGGGTDTLVANSATGAAVGWVINAAGGGTVNGTPFTGLANLTGGAGDDVFAFQPGGSLAGKLNAGTGKNWLDDSALTSSVTVNVSGSTYNSIPANSASNIFAGQSGGLTNVKYIRGGSSDDTLIGGGGNILIGGGGNDLLVNNSTSTAATYRSLLIGGLGGDTLTAGSAGDLLIGGTTNYDSNNAALLALLTEWGSTTDSYATRFSKIQSGVGSGGWQLVWGSTVQDDSAIDTLNGGPGLDWYFAQVSGTYTDIINGLAHGQEYLNNGLST